MFSVVISFCSSLLSSKKVVILIPPIGVFQGKFLPHGKGNHVIHMQNSPQDRVPFKNNPEKIIRFPLPPFGAGTYSGETGNRSEERRVGKECVRTGESRWS